MKQGDINVKRYSAAIKCIKSKLRQLVKEQELVRDKILTLKYLEGRRNPATGPRRCGLKQQYDQDTRWLIRYCLLAQGFLREIPYRTMEPNAQVENLIFVCHCTREAFQRHDLMQGDPKHKVRDFLWYAPRAIEAIIREAIGPDPDLLAEWPIDRIVKLIFENETVVRPESRYRLEAVRKTAEAIKFERMQALFPDLSSTTKTLGPFWCSTHVVKLAQDCEFRHWGGLRLTGPLEVWPFVDTVEGRVYSSPVGTVVGDLVGQNYVPRPGWSNTLSEQGFSDQVIQKVSQYLEKPLLEQHY